MSSAHIAALEIIKLNPCGTQPYKPFLKRMFLGLTKNTSANFFFCTHNMMITRVIVVDTHKKKQTAPAVAVTDYERVCGYVSTCYLMILFDAWMQYFTRKSITLVMDFEALILCTSLVYKFNAQAL